MNKEEKLAYIEDYLKKYFDEMLIEDIKMIKNAKPELFFTIPYNLLVSAGIDFLGGLKEGFGSSSPQRSRNFIEKWMGEVNPLYREENMSNLIYNCIRCGLSHQAMLKKGFESYSGPCYRGNHLHVRINPKGKKRIFIHALQFADDFIGAQKLFRKDYIKLNIDTTYTNLIKVLQEKVGGLSDLIKNLEDKGFLFEEEISPSPSPAPEE